MSGDLPAGTSLASSKPGLVPRRLVLRFVFQAIVLFYFFENKRRERWNKPPGMRSRPEEGAVLRFLSRQFLETVPL